MRRSVLIAAIAACTAGAAHAQGGIELRHTRLAGAGFGDARLHGREDGLRVRSPEFPLATGRTTAGLEYAYTRYEYAGLPTRARDLHRLALPLRWAGGDAYLWQLSLSPTVATSSNVFKDLLSRGSGDDVALHAAASVGRAPVRGWGWRIGAAYDDVFGSPGLHPDLAATWRGGDVALLFGWPRMRATWQARDRLQFRFDLAPAGRRWHVVSDERDGAAFFHVVDAWRGTLGMRWEIAAGWRLHADAGYEFDRRHRLEDDTGAYVDRRADAAGMVSLALRYGF